MKDIFLREEMLLGAASMERLRNSHVIVFGIGGVGSYVCEGLARAGIGEITLVDHDTVSPTNINRQLCALHSTIGRPKCTVMAERILDINPDCLVHPMEAFYSAESSEQFFSSDRKYDFIVDAIDLVSCKLHLIQTAKQLGIPIVSAMGTGNKYHPELFRITDISKTSCCPLARIMRKELRERGITHHTVLFSTELTSEPEQSETPPPGRRSIPGSLSWVPSCAGLMIAGYVVQTLTENVSSPNTISL